MALNSLTGRKRSQKYRQVKVSFRELKAQIYWSTKDQKVRGSNPCGRTLKKSLSNFSIRVLNCYQYKSKSKLMHILGKLFCFQI